MFKDIQNQFSKKIIAVKRLKKIIGEGVTSRSRDFWLLSEDNNVKV